MMVVDVSFVIVDRFLGVSRLTDWLASGRVGTGVQPLQGENYTYSRILDHVQFLIRLHFHRVVLLDILYLPLVYFPARIAVEVRGAGVLAPKSGVLGGVC